MAKRSWSEFCVLHPPKPHILYLPIHATSNITAKFDNLTEHRGPIELAIKGTIPAWAAGSLFRVGPGARKIEHTKTSKGNKGEDGTVLISHWFDGLAHLHRFDIVPTTGDATQPVKVLYSSRRHGEDFVKYVQEKGSFGDTISFGQRADPCVGIFSKVMTCFRALDEAKALRRFDNFNVAVVSAIDVPALAVNKSSSPAVSPPGTDPDNSKATSGHTPKMPDAPIAGHRSVGSSSRLWLTTDNSGLRAVDATTLAPLGPVTLQRDLHASLQGSLSCAHPQRCPETGDLFNYNLECSAPGTATYRVFRVSAATGETDVLATIARPGLAAAYVHSFFLSRRFVALRVPSSHLAETLGSAGLSLPWTGSIAGALRRPWDADRRCRWFVVDRVHGSGVVAEFETPAAFFFHSVNCWDEIVDAPSGEEGSGRRAADVFFDVVDFPNMDIVYKHYYDILLNRDGEAQKWHADEARAKNCLDCSLVRWKVRVPLPTAAPRDERARGDKPSPSRLSKTKKKETPAEPEVVFAIPGPHAGELPTINPDYRTRPHRYVYSLPQTGRSTFLDTIVKTDTATREVLQWDNPAGHTPGEAIFVARPGGEDEDDGVLLSVVLDGRAERSYLVCLDARAMEELGRAEMDFAVAFGLHGMHASSQAAR